MIYPKTQFEKEIEYLSKDFEKTAAAPFVKDFSDCIVFSCVFAGKNNASIDKIQMLKKSENNYVVLENMKDVDKSKLFPATKYSLNSYDKVFTLTVITSPEYYLFEKVNDTGLFHYKAEYFLDKNGNFVRKCELKHEKLSTPQEISEVSYGTMKDGLYHVETKEKHSHLFVTCFKLPTVDKSRENVYFNYQTDPDSIFMCRAISEFKKVPFLESLGMNTLSTMLSEQFEGEEEPVRIDDEMFFKQLLSTAKTYYYKKEELKPKIPAKKSAN